MRLLGLDALRAICAVAVLGFHYFYLGPMDGSVPWPAYLPEVWQYGYLGVPVFFMISGFVICWSAAGGTRPRFLVGRVTRLLPTFWLCLALACAALWIAGRPAPPEQVAANLVIAAPFLGQEYLDPVYWSLVVEVLFYAAVWCMMGAAFHRRLSIFAGIWLALAAVNLVVRLPGQAILNPLWAPFFCVGIYAFLGKPRLSALAAVLGGAAAWLHATGFDARATDPLAAGAIAAALGLAFPYLTRMPIPAGLQRAAMIGGAASYPLYLLHLEFGVALGLPLVPMTVTVIAVSIAVGVAEAPIRQRLRRISVRRRPWASAAAD